MHNKSENVDKLIPFSEMLVSAVVAAAAAVVVVVVVVAVVWVRGVRFWSVGLTFVSALFVFSDNFSNNTHLASQISQLFVFGVARLPKSKQLFQELSILRF